MGLEKGYVSPKYKGVKEDLRIAKELGYSRTVIDMLTNEPDRIKRTRIMHDARLGKILA